MATIETIHEEMFAYNQSVAYGSECNAWQGFVEDMHSNGYDHNENPEQPVSDEFAEYWQAVANGESSDFDAETGNYLG